MAHVGDGSCCHLGGWIGLVHETVAAISIREESLGSCWNHEPDASQQQQRAASLVQHGIEGLMLVLGTAK